MYSPCAEANRFRIAKQSMWNVPEYLPAMMVSWKDTVEHDEDVAPSHVLVRVELVSPCMVVRGWDEVKKGDWDVSCLVGCMKNLSVLL